MKINTKYYNQLQNRRSGFTLIEMIGVLAVIAILAALLIPKIFEAINNARVNNAAVTCGTVKTAIADHYAKFGALTADGTTTPPGTITPIPNPDYDTFLLREGFLDKPFAVKIGDGATGATGTRIELDTAVANNVAPTAGASGNAAFNLDGTPASGSVAGINDANGSSIVYAVITGVTLNDARDLNTRLDGSDTALGESVPTPGAESDIAGRVKYTFTGGAPTTVYVYLTHR